MKNTHKILSLACLLTVSNPSLLVSKHEVILPLTDEGDTKGYAKEHPKNFVTLRRTPSATVIRTKITPGGEEFQKLQKNTDTPILKTVGGNPLIYDQARNEYRKQRSSQPKNKPQKVAHLISKEGEGYDWLVLKETGSVLHALVFPNPEATQAELWDREGNYKTYPAGDNNKLLSTAEETFLRECLHLKSWKIQQMNGKEGEQIDNAKELIKALIEASAIGKNISKQTAFPAGDNNKLLNAKEKTFLKERLRLKSRKIQQMKDKKGEQINNAKKLMVASTIGKSISKQTQVRDTQLRLRRVMAVSAISKNMSKQTAFPAGDNNKLLNTAEEAFLRECLHLKSWKIQQMNGKEGEQTNNAKKLIEASAIGKNISKQTQVREWAKRRVLMRDL